jgi:hypothetical protein
MQPFRILYFRQSVLKRAETGDGDLLEVIEQATEHGSGERAEIWSEELGKVGVVEPLPRQNPGRSEQRFDEPQSEIAKEMTQRLNLVQEPGRLMRKK